MNSSDDRSEAQVLETIMRSRFSCRGFRDTPIPPADLDRLWDMAQHTASWCNSQPWEVILCSGAATAAFSAALRESIDSQPIRSDIPSPERYTGKYKERRRAAGFGLYESLGIARDDSEGRMMQGLENYRFFGAPHVAIITTEADLGTYGAVDCGGYITSVLLAAKSLGIDSCAQAAIALYSDTVRNHFSLPASRQTVCAISLGYSDKDNLANGFRTERAAVETVVTQYR